MKYLISPALVFVFLFYPLFYSFAAKASPEKQEETVWYLEPGNWAAASAVGVVAYMLGSRVKEGLPRVAQAFAPVAVGMLGVSGMLSYQLKNRAPVLLLTASIVAYMLYKSYIVCPKTGAQGCCCHGGT